MNEAAFCYMAVTGDNFCPSAWKGFLLNLNHGLQFAFANSIAKVFILLGKLGIVAANCFTCFFIMKFITKDIASALTDDEGNPLPVEPGQESTVKSIWGPIVIVGIVTYLTASLLLGLFD